MYRRYIKRGIDIIASAIALLILSPLFLVVILWLSVVNKGEGAFFMQQRPGKDGRLFKIIKFRSMTDRRDSSGNLLSDKERLTKAGRIIRATSIDELPQLINVIKGEMSIVGPRPLLPSYIPLYTPYQCRRHEVRPGITGWAQCHGRNAISWEEKFAFDVWYVDHCSLSTDIKALLATAKLLLTRENTYEVPVTPFTGSHPNQNYTKS